MIINKLIHFILSLGNVSPQLQSATRVPSVTPVWSQVSSFLLARLDEGLDLLAFFIGNDCLHILGVCLDIVIAVNLLYAIWSLICWTIDKIPGFNW